MEHTKKKSINLKELKAKVEKIEKMREKELSDEEIQEFLDLEVAPKQIIAEFEQFNNFKTVEEALEEINHELKAHLKKPMEKHTLLKLLRDFQKGEPGIKGEKHSNKTGYLVDADALKEYIERQKMSKEDLFKALEEANKRIAELEQELAAAKSKPKRTAPKQNADKAK